MKIGQASGLQVAFLSFGVMLLAVPLTRALGRIAGVEGTALLLLESGGHFFLAAAIIVAIPPLRRAVAGMLRPAIPRVMWTEVIGAWLLMQAAAIGGVAALALWFMVQDGPGWVTQMTRDVDRQLARAYTAPGLVMLLLSSTIGPFIEEIVFRGFVYRAFARQWGWLTSLVATSALFGLYHPHFWSAFTGSVIMICVLRRTGSLRAPILIHMVFNFLLWPPLLGQHAFPEPADLTQPSSWLVHGACLVFAAIAVPAYVYMSRDRAPAPTVFIQPDGAFQK
jgi:membrane protease YdiL (CAAX protease family)